MKRKKINILVGGTFHFPMMLQRLEEQGYDVVVYSSTPSFKIKQSVSRKRIKFIPQIFQIVNKCLKIKIPQTLRYVDTVVFDFLASIIMRRCDILIGFAGCSLISGRVNKRHGAVFLVDRACPHFGWIQDRLADESKNLQIPFSKPLKAQFLRNLKEYQVADGILIPSTYTERSFREEGFVSEKLYLVGLEPPHFNYNDNKSHLVKKGEVVIGAVGNGLARKGFFYLIKAFTKIPKSNILLKLRTNKSELYQQHEVRVLMESDSRIEVVEYVNDINDFYKSIDIFCSSSFDDGFSAVLVEAMRNGNAVVTTNTTGASDFVDDNENGLIIPSRDVAALKSSLEYLITNPALRASMGQNAKLKMKNVADANLYGKNLNLCIEKSSSQHG